VTEETQLHFVDKTNAAKLSRRSVIYDSSLLYVLQYIVTFVSTFKGFQCVLYNDVFVREYYCEEANVSQ